MYNLLLWVILAMITVHGYISYYKRCTLDVEGKVNVHWSRALDLSGRVRVQWLLLPVIKANSGKMCYTRTYLLA